MPENVVPYSGMGTLAIERLVAYLYCRLDYSKFMATVPKTSRATRCDRVVLMGIPWQLYESLRDIDDNWHLRMTYDRGKLELMSPSAAHERIKKQIARLIEVLTFELGNLRYSLGQTTWKQPKLQKALEADESYYIRNEARVRGQEEFDLQVDQPPRTWSLRSR